MSNSDPMGDIVDLMSRLGAPAPTSDGPGVLKEWTHDGLKCQIIRGGYNALCGYVEVPESNPAHGVHYDDDPVAELQVHGGTTFSGPGRLTGDGWWIGFDTMHYGDTPEAWPIERVRDETNKLASQIASLT